MVDYSFANEIKFVPKLSSRVYQSEYHEWEDVMEDFLYDRGLESYMKIHFARRTFSECVLRWWIKLQQGHVDRGEDPCSTWSGMKKVLRRRYDPPHEKTFSPKKTLAAGNHSSFDTKAMTRSSWIDSIVGDVNEPQQGATTKSYLAENMLRCSKEKSNVPKSISPCKEHGKSVVLFSKYISPSENRKKYASARDVPKSHILSGISSTSLKHVRSSSAAGHKGNFCLDEAEKRLHKLQELLKQEKKEKNVAAEIFLSPKLNEEVHSNANESKDETSIEDLNLLGKKDESANTTAAQTGQ
ncbi:hypothetical protein GUJ93_ZPchr0012g19028 [Zizania palustris]|uniref:Uncharacterized protein n=1 Tax=Zizania palustris TaxID=103762 RepID=A0A8J5WX01_ZIZPA|nr:hypothetical protein GUJ93_ZPchr0012g19028 [Zizania palustris]